MPSSFLVMLLFVGSGAPRSSTRWSGSSCCSWSSARRLCHWACCSAPSWAACAWAACSRHDSSRAAITRCMSMRLSRRPSACWGSRCCSRCRWSPGFTWRSAAMVRRVSLSGRSSRASVFFRRPLRWAPRSRRSAGGSRRRPAVGRGSGCSTPGNLAGAVIGCLLAGFYLLRVFDMAVATYVAVAINLCVAGRRLVRGAWSPGNCDR